MLSRYSIALKLIIISLVSASFLTSCTSHLYSGFASYETNNKQCDAMLYWHGSTSWFKQSHDDSAVVLLQASSHRAFVFSPAIQHNLNGVSTNIRWLILPKDLYSQSDKAKAALSTVADLPALTKTQVNCGYLSLGKRNDDTNLANPSFTFYCDALAHPLKPTPELIPARAEAYDFKMQTVTSSYSWFGEHQPVDAKLTCRPI